MPGSPQSIESMQSWNQVSATFLEGRLAEDSIDYGPLCPLDDELRLIQAVVGDLTGIVVLDAGCGGGQNTVHFARLGAQVTALDFSERQLDSARIAATNAGVNAHFVLGDITTLSAIADASQDLLFCTHTFPYVDEIEQALASCRRVLRPGGKLIASMDHPLRSCFMDPETSELSNYAERSYWSASPRRWTFDGTQTTMHSCDRPVSMWIDLLRDAGLPLIQLLEPPVPAEVLDHLFPDDGPLASLRNIPHTLILVGGAS